MKINIFETTTQVPNMWKILELLPPLWEMTFSVQSFESRFCRASIPRLSLKPPWRAWCWGKMWVSHKDLGTRLAVLYSVQGWFFFTMAPWGKRMNSNIYNNLSLTKDVLHFYKHNIRSSLWIIDPAWPGTRNLKKKSVIALVGKRLLTSWKPNESRKISQNLHVKLHS